MLLQHFTSILQIVTNAVFIYLFLFSFSYAFEDENPSSQKGASSILIREEKSFQSVIGDMREKLQDRQLPPIKSQIEKYYEIYLPFFKEAQKKYSNGENPVNITITAIPALEEPLM